MSRERTREGGVRSTPGMDGHFSDSLFSIERKCGERDLGSGFTGTSADKL